MKNIHLLATPNQSRLFYFGNSSVLTLNKYPALFRAFERSTQYVYITNEEKFVRDEYVTDGTEVIKATPKLVDAQDLVDRRDWKKIILTTDTKLIEDGVQSIPDEFLEWFVKNQICEEVKVEGHIYKGQDETEYKIITPKKEQKQHLIDIMALDEKLGLYEDGSPGYNKQAELVKQLANELKSEGEILYNESTVRQIAEWSFHFYKRNDLSDSELEDEWERLLNERLKKK